MAELRSSTSVGGNLVWHSGNLRFDVQGDTIRYSGFKIYTENDKPDPHADLTEPAVKVSGDTVFGELTLKSTTHIDVGSLYVAMEAKNTAEYVAIDFGAVSKDFDARLLVKNSDGRTDGQEGHIVWNFGSHIPVANRKMLINGWEVLNTNNYASLIDSRYVNATGDTMSGPLTITDAGGLATEGRVTINADAGYNAHLNFNDSANIRAGTVFANNATRDIHIRKFETNGTTVSSEVVIDDGRVNVTTGVLQEAGQRVFSPNNRNITDSTNTTSSLIYASASAVKSANDNATTRVRRSGDTMTGNLVVPKLFANGTITGQGSDAAALQVNGYTRTGNIYLHSGGNTPDSVRPNDALSNVNGSLRWRGNEVFTANSYTSLDSRYVNVTGDTISGRLTITGSPPDAASATLVLQNGLGGAGDWSQSALIRVANYAPAIDFHDLSSASSDNPVRIMNDGNLFRIGLWSNTGATSADFAEWVIVGDDRFRYKGNSVFHDGYHPNADTWTTSRTLTLGGDLTGSVSFNGSSNFTLNAQVVNDSHNHTHSDADFTVNGLLTSTGDTNVSGTLTASNTTVTNNLTVDGYIDTSATESYEKIRLWSATGYSIGMVGNQSFGWLDNDFAMTFTMRDISTRGFLWRDVNHGITDGAMSLSTNGNLNVRNVIGLAGNNGRYLQISENDGSWKFHSDNGVEWHFGSRNTSWVHNSTDATNGFYYYQDIQSAGNVTAYSDARVKTNIERIDNALEKVMALNGYTYDRTDVETARQTGVIAQEVLEVLPEAVTEAGDDSSHYAVAYGNMVGLLIEAIKQQQDQIEELKKPWWKRLLGV